MRERREDVSIWIGYADFLTTLTVLFLVVAVSFAGKSHTGNAIIKGRVLQKNGAPLQVPCRINIADSVLARTSARDSRFQSELKGVQGVLTIVVSADCQGYESVPRLLRIRAAQTLPVDLMVQRSSVMKVETIPGDALFDTNSSTLKPEAVTMIASLGLRMKPSLNQGDVIAVEGHTDDDEFRANSGRDNWVLSAERANAAAKVLISSGISACNVVIMGFGPSRPLDPILGIETRAQKQEKRARNRRIQFRQLRSVDLKANCGN